MEKKPVVLNEKDFAVLYDVATSMHTICDLDEMMGHIFNKIKSLLNIQGVSIALHDSKSREFVFIRTVEDGTAGSPRMLPELKFPDNLGIAGWVLRENRSAMVNDVRKDKRFYGGMDRKVGFSTRSMVCVPLNSRKGLMGVLYAINKLSGRFTRKEVRLLEMLSGNIAISIENATLYGELLSKTDTLRQENRNLRRGFEDRFRLQGIIGTSNAMRDVFYMVDKVLDNKTTVLLQGETGTGKELVAKVIHYSGILKEKPFVAENCGALTETLLESELFGHVRGAFTGAVSDREGLFERANGGTVFLDEIAETTPAMQVKLLRVIQEGQIRRVGGRHPINVNTRLILSTHRDLERAVAAGTFREDLFYRINVYPIRLPSLRKRLEDIPLLADFFLKRYAKRHGRAADSISPSAMGLLMNYDWPGNVRQLENEIERAVTLAGSRKVIQPEHFSEKINILSRSFRNLPKGETRLSEAVGALERGMIKEALRDLDGNRSAAARRLGLTRQGLLLKIKRYGVE
jgi:Nif-specific regulatory protein